MSEPPASEGQRAGTVVVSYPADLSEWGRESVAEESFRAYLRRVHETATVGDEWAEFVGVGCCGDTLDVPLRVEAVETERAETAADATEQSSAIDEDTTFAFEERAACGVAGGWDVQSQTGP